ncbi:MAG: hypothetical protein ABSH32_25450 [Bryobacteraceae bacterium]
MLEGVPVNTFDLDIVDSREPDNIRRLLTSLASSRRLTGRSRSWR